MIKISSNISKVIAKFQKAQIEIRKRQGQFLAEQEKELVFAAKDLVQSVVYDRYEPRVYDRTGDLKESIKSELSDGGERLFIYQDAVETPLKGSGKHPGYGHYFIVPTGRGFVERRVPYTMPRDFLRSWYFFFNQILPKDYYRIVVQGGLKSAGFRVM